MKQKYALGIMGLGVMGRSLAQNFERNGFPVTGYDIKPRPAEDYSFHVTNSIEGMAASLILPRKVLIMVPAGAPVDTAIHALVPYLQPGDIIIDGGNSYYEDTARRLNELQPRGILFCGMGVSGGEQGALWGPSLMPGGDPACWPYLQAILETISAKAADGVPCAAWMGTGGAGHFVKMVHNGIEYADMQLIAETYDFLHRGAGSTNAELADLFAKWNSTNLRSYLIEITARILTQADPETGQPLVDLILDEAGQKGTGSWASQEALRLGIPVPGISAAVESRFLSARRSERQSAAQLLGAAVRFTGERGHLQDIAREAIYASKVTVYAQGLSLLKAASMEFAWDLDLAAVLRVWRAGCIIRADILNEMAAAYYKTPDLPSLLVDEFFRTAILEHQSAWREALQSAIGLGIPMPGTSACLSYFDAYRSARLPANLIQAQRDYFGAHTYRRLDREGVFHTTWED